MLKWIEVEELPDDRSFYLANKYGFEGPLKLVEWAETNSGKVFAIVNDSRKHSHNYEPLESDQYFIKESV